MSSNSLINFGGLSKPATVLIEKISAAVGGIFKPYQIVRVAKAEAAAERIRAEAQGPRIKSFTDSIRSRNNSPLNTCPMQFPVE